MDHSEWVIMCWWRLEEHLSRTLNKSYCGLSYNRFSPLCLSLSANNMSYNFDLSHYQVFPSSLWFYCSSISSWNTADSSPEATITYKANFQGVHRAYLPVLKITHYEGLCSFPSRWQLIIGIQRATWSWLRNFSMCVDHGIVVPRQLWCLVKNALSIHNENRNIYKLQMSNI